MKFMLDGVSNGMRSFADNVRIQLLAAKDSLSQKIPSTCFCVIQVLRLDANAPVREPKMAASGEIVAGFQDPRINLMFGR